MRSKQRTLWHYEFTFIILIFCGCSSIKSFGKFPGYFLCFYLQVASQLSFTQSFKKVNINFNPFSQSSDAIFLTGNICYMLVCFSWLQSPGWSYNDAKWILNGGKSVWPWVELTTYQVKVASTTIPNAQIVALEQNRQHNPRCQIMSKKTVTIMKIP